MLMYNAVPNNIVEKYNNALGDMMVRLLWINRCRPSEFCQLKLEEVHRRETITSKSGEKYVVANPIKHKTGRRGIIF